MASGSKADLARAGTMEVTSKEGKAYLEKNLTEWKKPLLIDQQTDDKSTGSGKKGGATSAAQKAKLAKVTTMDVTAKEGRDLIGDKKLGDTRQVTKSKQKASPKRVGTMAQAVTEAKAVYGGGLSSGGGRSLRKRPASSPAPKKAPAKKVAKKAAMKKAGTMQNTAKEAATLLGGEQLGDTRLVTKAKKRQAKAKAKKAPKKKAGRKSK